MSSRKIVASVVLAAFTSAACGVENLPPPAAPDRIVPRIPVEPGPPDQGEGRVLVDASSGPAQVRIVLNRGVTVAQMGGYVGTMGTMTTANLCASTPCAVNLPYGQYELMFQSRTDEERQSSDTVTVGARPSVFRHELGRQEDPRGARQFGATAITFGVIGLATGASFLFTSAVTSSNDSNGASSSTSSTLTTAGIITIGVGAVLTALGIGLLIAGRPKVQPGSSVQWTPDGASMPVSGGRVVGDTL